MRLSSRQPDVVVIGGGLIGCSIAMRLAQAGLRITVVERATPGAEASSAAAGMLSPQSEVFEPGPFFDLSMASRRMYPGFAREVEALSGFQVDYRREGTLLVATNRKERRELERIYSAQRKIGLPIIKLNRRAVHLRVPGLSSQIDEGLFIPGDHRVDNQKLSAAVALAGARLGVEIRSGTSVSRIVVRKSRVECIRLEDELKGRGQISGGVFVLAAGCWSAALAKPLGIRLPMKPCLGQMMEFEAPRALPLVVRAGHAYLVPRSDNRIVVGTTSEYVGFEKRVTGTGLRSLLNGALRILPQIQEFKFLRAWAGLRPDTADHLPVLGRSEISNLIFATGHFRNGILLAPITAKLISGLILDGTVSQPLEAFHPGRFTK